MMLSVYNIFVSIKNQNKANLTPDPDTRMGQATKEAFIARFAAFRSFDPVTAPPALPGQNTVMAWKAFSGMTDQDLGAIYDYLKTLPPIKNQVVHFPMAAASRPPAPTSPGSGKS